MRVPRISIVTSTTTPASSGPVRLRKPSALARIRSAGGQIPVPTDTPASERRFRASYVVIEVIVRHDTNVSAGEPGKWEANWDRLVTFTR
jgi:hypothetical protein